MVISVAVINLAGFIALLLWGTHMVQTGVQRAFGAKLRSILSNALKNRIYAFLAGVGVTAALQSSTATGLMVTGFAASGLIDLMPALAVMLGANVGTTLIVQMFSFDVSAFSPVLILAGVMMFRRDSTSRTHDLGRVFIGLGLMLLALHQLLSLLTPYKDSTGLRVVLNVISTIPLFDVILGTLITWAMHSSIAIVLLIMSFAANNVFLPDAAFALVLGANLGTALNPVLEGTQSGDSAAKRMPIGNLLNRAIGAAATLTVLGPITHWMVRMDADPGRMVANFHTLFNLVLAFIFLPLLNPYAKLLRLLMPVRVNFVDPSRPLYLDPAARETPIVALGGAAREALRLADVLNDMLRKARDVLGKGDRKLIGEIRRLDDVLDRLNTEIKVYLTSIDPDELGNTDHCRLDEIMAFTMNMEQAGDVVDHNLLPHASKCIKRGLAFSIEGQTELTAMMDRLIKNLQLAASLFITEDSRVARLLASEKVAFRQAESAATSAHFNRLRAGRIDTAETSAIHLDLLRDLKRINSHIVAAAAYPVLDRAGELLSSRLADDHFIKK